VLVKPSGVPAGLVDFAAGYYHALALDSTGKRWSWGYDALGQLGDAVETTHNVPIQVANLNNVSQIAAGDLHSMALKADGTVWAWGDNTSGQIGTGSDDGLIPGAVAVKGLAGIRKIAAGGASSAVLDSNGNLWTWGSNDNGQLAIGDDIDRDTSTPAMVNGLPPLVNVAVGGTHMLGIDAAGNVWAWGDNSTGQLGDGLDFDTPSPRQTDPFGKAVAIAAGYQHSLALDSNGQVWGWGSNSDGQLGFDDSDFSEVPVQIMGLPNNIIAVAAGYSMSYALGSDGTIWGWGSDYVGELGDGNDDQLTIVPVKALGDHYSALSAGAEHLLGLRSDGIVWASGWNYGGQLGDGTFGNRDSYTGVLNPLASNFLDLAPQVANLPIPPDKQLPFVATTQKIGGDLNLTIKTTIRLGASPLSQQARAAGSYNVYVGAVVPGKYVGLPASQTALYLKTRTQGWGPYVGGPIGEYMSSVSQTNDQGLLVDILASTDLSALVGVQFYVGYGTDANDMLSNGRLRMVYEVQKPH
jgi:alpha-tubulin suppressor-like RCC1 family protein